MFPLPGYRIPGSFRFSTDGKTLYYLYAQEGMERELWALNTADGSSSVAASIPPETQPETFEEEMRRQRQRLRWTGIASFDVRAGTILIAHRDELYVRQPSGPLRRVANSRGVVDPSLTPDGNSCVGVVDGDLCVIEMATGARRWVTHAAQTGITYGLAEYVAQEELDRSRGYWLSSDAQRIVFAEVDERHIPAYPIVHLKASGVWVESHPYPFVGQADAKVRLGVAALGSDGPPIDWIQWDGTDRYLLDVLWTHDGQIWVSSLSRTHQHLAWDRFDVSGKSLGRLYEETSPTWIFRAGQGYVTGTGQLISTTERDGLRRLLVVEPTGEWRTAPCDGSDGVVLDVLAVDAANHHAWVSATRNRALERTLVRMDWETGAADDWLPESGSHLVVAAAGGLAFVDIHSTRDSAPAVRLLRGETPLTIHESQCTHADLGWTRPEFFTAAADDGTVLNGLIYCPTGAAPRGGWPLVVAVYGGPGAQMVTDDWLQTVDLDVQYLVQRGFAVMKLDNRGSANRGRAFERVLHHHFGDAELADQIAGIRRVSQLWPVNLGRVGIFGWSYGGYMTLRALLMAPEIFRVGVAGAPVTDFRWYDTAYTERYLGTDSTNRAGYDSSALLDKAGRLTGKLLLIHGMVDENVHFRHSAAMIEAFIEAGKDFDLIVLPGSRHMVSSAQADLYRTRRQLQFFETHL